MEEFIDFISLYSSLTGQDSHRLHILSDVEDESAFAIVLPERPGDDLDTTYIYQYFPEQNPPVTGMMLDMSVIEWLLPLLRRATGN